MRVAARLVRAGERAILDTSPLGPAVYTAAWAALEPEYGPVAEEMTASVVRSLRNGTLGLPVRVVVLTVPESDLREGGRAVRPRRPSDLAARHLRVARGERRFWRRLAARSSGSVRFVRATGSVAEVAYRAERALLRAGPPLTVRAVVAELRSFAGSATPGPTSTLKNRT